MTKIKKKIKWLIYLAFVTGTALFAFYEYQQSQQEQKEKSTNSLIFPNLKPREVQSIVLKEKKQDKKIFLFRKGRGWRVSSPVEKIADRDIVGDWLTTLLAEKVQLIKTEGIDWAEYGLEKDIKTIEITTTNKKKIKINISDYSAFDGHFYIQKEGVLLLGSTGWANLTSKEGDYFRSYKIINEVSPPTFIEYRSPAFSAHLKWENNQWQWDEKGNKQDLDQKTGTKNHVLFPLSPSALEAYWSALKNIRFEKKTYPNIKSLRKKWSNKPLAEFRIGFQNTPQGETRLDGETHLDGGIHPEGETLKASSAYSDGETRGASPAQSEADSSFDTSEGNYSDKILEIKIYPSDLDSETKTEAPFYVQVSNRDDIFTLSQEKGRELFLTKQKIRDHSYPFQFDREAVTFMDIKGYGMDLKLEKKKRTWIWLNENTGDKTKSIGDKKKKASTAVAESRIKKINKEKLTEVISKIPHLSVKQYFGKNKPFEKTAYMILKGREEEYLLRLDFSAPFEVTSSGKGSKKTKKKSQKSDKKSKKWVFVKSSQGQEVMTLPWGEVQELFSPALLQ